MPPLSSRRKLRKWVCRATLSLAVITSRI
jgi:hypothetical protein